MICVLYDVLLVCRLHVGDLHFHLNHLLFELRQHLLRWIFHLILDDWLGWLFATILELVDHVLQYRLIDLLLDIILWVHKQV